MRSENISDAIGMLDEEMLGEALRARRKEEGKCRRLEKRKMDEACRSLEENKTGKIKYAAAACLGLVGLSAAAILFVVLREPEMRPYQEGITPGSQIIGEIHQFEEPADDAYGQDQESEAREEFVEVSSLLAVQSPGAVQEMSMAFTRVPIEQYTGFYTKVDSVGSDVLKAGMGECVEGTESYYRVLGHADLQYLIRKEAQEFSLWKFGYFESEEYPYRDVLELVYRIYSAEGITGMEVSPARMDNTDEGRRIQEAVGTHVITDKDAIETLYHIISSMICYGSDRWDLINYGNAEADTNGNTDSNGNIDSHDAVRLGRYLTFTTDYGNEIDGLKYTAVSDMFYEFSGVAYHSLEKEQAESIWEIIGITKEEIAAATQDQESTAESENITQPLEEPVPNEQSPQSFLQEAVNRNASLEEITELQNRVSSAMINHELPFVISSAIYENPYRLHIEVTSDTESDLQKLLELDTLGGVLEIEYAAGNESRLE